MIFHKNLIKAKMAPSRKLKDFNTFTGIPSKIEVNFSISDNLPINIVPTFVFLGKSIISVNIQSNINLAIYIERKLDESR